jgi:hypothetical protein
MGPDGAAAGSQGGSAGARLEGGRSTGIAPVSGAQPEQRKGDGFVRVFAREGVRLTCGVREVPGLAWQRPKEADGVGRLHPLNWAEAEPSWAGRGENGPR